MLENLSMQMTILLTQKMAVCSAIEQANRVGNSVSKKTDITNCKQCKQQVSEFHYYDIPNRIMALSLAGIPPSFITTGFHFSKKLNLI